MLRGSVGTLVITNKMIHCVCILGFRVGSLLQSFTMGPIQVKRLVMMT